MVDNISIGPVVLDNDFNLKQKADSVLSGYARVESTIKNGVVTLNSETKKEQAESLCNH